MQEGNGYIRLSELRKFGSVG